MTQICLNYFRQLLMEKVNCPIFNVVGFGMTQEFANY